MWRRAGQRAGRGCRPEPSIPDRAPGARKAAKTGFMGAAISSSKFVRLRRRSEYVALRRGGRYEQPAFSLQTRRRSGGEGVDTAAPRFGFTVTRRTGNAVERNRIRRRLKEAVRLKGAALAFAGHDYVLIGKRAALTHSFAGICSQLERALSEAARGRARTDRALASTDTLD